MTPNAPLIPARQRSRPEIGLIVLYSAVALSLLGSLGAGLALTGGGGLVTRADLGANLAPVLHQAASTGN